MAIVVEKPKIGMRGKRAKHFVAYTSADIGAVEICRGDIDQSAAEVRTRAIDLLAQAAEQRVTHVRAVAPGMDGAACDVWILQGDPVFGFNYGRVYAIGGALGDGKGRPTLHTTSGLGTRNECEALEMMLTHMADRYPPEHWDQFLWSSRIDVAAIRTEIMQRDAKRAAFKQGHF
jgi:hypothetical protein